MWTQKQTQETCQVPVSTINDPQSQVWCTQISIFIIMITKVVSASSGARITHLDHASVFIHSVNAINYTALVSEICESLHPHFIAFNNTSELWAEKKINETFAIKVPSFLTNFLVRFHAPRGPTPYARRSEMLPCSLHNHFFLLLLAILSRKADTTRQGPQTPPSHMYPFLQTRFYYFFFFFTLK